MGTAENPSRAKKIVFLEDSPAWGGVQKCIFTLAEGLKKNNWSIAFATPKEGNLARKARKLSVEVFPWKLKSFSSLLNPFTLKKFTDFLKTNEIDILFINGSKELKFGAIAAYFAKTPKVIYRRGVSLPMKNKWYNRFFINRIITSIITNSQSSKENILKEFGGWLSPEKIKVVYNGIDCSPFYLEGEKFSVHESLNIPSDYIIITSIGRLSKQKGYEFSFEALARLYKNFKKFHMLIIGKGKLEGKLKQEAKEKGLNNNISFLGFREDIPAILRVSDFLLLTPLWEGAPNVILEAMACAKPVVSWKVSGIPELVENEVTGYLSEKGDIEGLTANIQRMFDDILSSRAEKIGQAARRRVEKYFSQQKMLEEYIKILG